VIIRSSLEAAPGAEALAFHGELDAAAAPDLQGRLREVVDEGGGALLVDLTRCSFIDSTGIAVIVDCHRSLDREGRALVVAASSAHVRRLLGLAGIDEVVPVCWSREEGEELLAGG
jgi:anti-sigma B factor antagonist